MKLVPTTMRSASMLLQGGWDISTPALALKPGMLISGENYEPEVRGYRRYEGYERYDGQPRPSSASYWVLRFDGGTTAISDGDQVTGATSGATGEALQDATVEAGSWGGGDAEGYIVLGDVTGTFVEDEDLQVSAVTRAVADDDGGGVANERGATLDADDLTFLSLSVENRRSDITVVPGEGAVRGLFVLNGVLYAIRNNVGSTAGVIHKATTSGWTSVDLGHYIDFTAGTAEFLDGETVTGGTSGATGVIRRVVLQSGAWSGTAAGRLTISGISGTFQAAETITSASGSATCSGAQTANALPAGGKYHFSINNFYGSLYDERAYGCQGEGYAFEFDGTYFTEAITGIGASIDKPIRVAHLSSHLFLFYSSGYVAFSEIGEPLEYTTTGGAGAFEFGAEVTGVPEEESTALIIFGRSQIGYITGNDANDFALNDISHDAGAVPWSVQVAGEPVYVDDAGMRSLQATETFGNWRVGSMTQQVEPYFKTKRKAGAMVSASIRVRARDQYRLFFDDATGLTVYMGRGRPEVIPFRLDHTVNVTAVGYLTGEEQESFFVGTDDGYVMELEKGRSFDGGDILAWIRLGFNNLQSPQREKCFDQLILEIDAPASASLSTFAEFDYSNPDQPTSTISDLDVAAGGGWWNEANWNEFFWSSQVVGEAQADIDGIGRNVSVVISSEEGFEEPHTITAASILYSFRGLKR